MSFIAYHEGCGMGGPATDCFGPAEPFYTIFKTPLQFIYIPLGISLIVSVAVLGVLLLLRKKNYVRWTNVGMGIAVAALFVLLFAFTASMTWVVY
jgi:hypothetical protein